jgi:hypothetical protein
MAGVSVSSFVYYLLIKYNYNVYTEPKKRRRCTKLKRSDQTYAKDAGSLSQEKTDVLSPIAPIEALPNADIVEPFIPNSNYETEESLLMERINQVETNAILLLADMKK